ncbi:Serine/threonine-protein phosphatase 7 long form [Quillaja saponaria]|uniref:Serine/threonine-protein phosphatase 7 long form n=1 Tax=Quillaja saponaria TaxID=32244 RepID=A0AAD7LT29_QUISA|nr:Serine/threonine-protein phosphatase 7 long form [Quillaja saponaria]
MASKEEELKAQSFCIYEARDERMVSPKDGKSEVRLARFLKPCVTSVNQAAGIPNIPFLSETFSHKSQQWVSKVNFKGWKRPQGKLNEWMYRLGEKYVLIWNQSGIRDAILSSQYEIRCNRDLILGLVEYWCPETNTFVFPWGEATITLEDIMILGGFSVLGEPVNSPLTKDLQKIEGEVEEPRKRMMRNLPGKFIPFEFTRGNISFFGPARSFKPAVSLRYLNWWKESMLTRNVAIENTSIEGRRVNNSSMSLPVQVNLNQDFLAQYCKASPEQVAKKSMQESHASVTSLFDSTMKKPSLDCSGEDEYPLKMKSSLTSATSRDSGISQASRCEKIKDGIHTKSSISCKSHTNIKSELLKNLDSDYLDDVPLLVRLKLMYAFGERTSASKSLTCPLSKNGAALTSTASVERSRKKDINHN